MPILHILKADAGRLPQEANILRGLYGEITKRDGQLWFEPDEALANCTNTMALMKARVGFPVEASEIMTIEDEAEVVNSIKAILAHGIGKRWGNGYEVLKDRYQAPNSFLNAALEAEQQVAKQGIAQLISRLPGIVPHVGRVTFKDVYAKKLSNNEVHIGRKPAAVEYKPSDDADNDAIMQAEGQTMADQIDAETGEITLRANDFIDGTIDVDVMVPVFLPGVSRINRLLGLIKGGSEKAVSVTPERTKALRERVMNILVQTPILMEMVFDNNTDMVLDYSTIKVKTTHDNLLSAPYDDSHWEDEDEDEDDEYEDGYYIADQNRPGM